MSESLETLAERLDAIAEEIAESAIVELKDAVRRGERQRPAAERSLTQARRAVEKAAHLLRAAARSDSDELDGIADSD